MATLKDLIELRLKQDNSTQGYVRLINEYRNEKWNISFDNNSLQFDKGIRFEDFPPDAVLQGEVTFVLLKTILGSDDFYVFTMKDPGIIEAWVKEN